MAKTSGDRSTRASDGSPSGGAGSPTQSLFVISPIGHPGTPEHRRARQVLDYIVKKAFPLPDWRVIRADDESSPDSITSQVIDRIVNSDLIVADLTGHNPNVFYELAVAHGYQKAVLYLITEGEKLPFDVIDQRAIFYDLSDPASVDEAIHELVASQQWVEEHGSTLRTPLTMHGRFTAISESKSGTDGNEAIATALEEMLFRLRRLERATIDAAGPIRLPADAYKDASRSARYKPSSPRRISDDDRMSLLEQLSLIDTELETFQAVDIDNEAVVEHLSMLRTERARLLQSLDRH